MQYTDPLFRPQIPDIEILPLQVSSITLDCTKYQKAREKRRRMKNHKRKQKRRKLKK
jgi:hypothetical protein